MRNAHQAIEMTQIASDMTKSYYFLVDFYLNGWLPDENTRIVTDCHVPSVTVEGSK